MDVNCKGRRAVVTAGGSGIGRVIAETLADNGARVFVCDVAEDYLEAFASARSDIGATRADVSSAQDVARLFDEATNAMGGVDVLVNNAGVAGPTKRVEDISDEEWRSTIGVDVDGQFYCARLAVPLMLEAGRGAIVNISSTAGRLAFPLRLPYATAKRAVIGLTDTLAMELGPRNISVNAVLPGYVLNDRGRRVMEAKAEASGRTVDEIKAIILSRISMRSGIEEQEIADLVLYLCSHQGRHISGQAISIDANLETYAGMDKLD
ncbi:MAG: SDR family oxidoreductase [Alphaproteobacteria bacterium]|jgi:NAD(P)-dependent dehydrogenase (short-subunit alcohol dehydrogenase family)|nr:SDR family oxidoreductase [Alphaproteobacteria bacterium]MDP6818171.1 SDR family oxidoreductase [Alphaproteobacteria bacterium]